MDYQQSNGLKKTTIWSKFKNWRGRFLILFVLILLALAYLKLSPPSYQLSNFLPTDYSLALEISNKNYWDKKMEQTELSWLKDLNRQLNETFDQLLSHYPASDQKILKAYRQALIYSQTENDFTVLLNLSRKNLKRLLDSQTDLKQKALAENLIAISARPEPLTQLGIQNIKGGPVDNQVSSKLMSFYFGTDFFSTVYQVDWLKNLQQTLKPLAENPEQGFKADLYYFSHQLVLNLNRQSAKNQEKTSELEQLTPYLSDHHDFLIGLEEVDQIIEKSTSNPALKVLIDQLAQSFWQETQTDLNQMLLELKGPALFQSFGKQWRLIVKPENLPMIEKSIKQYLAQFRPTKKAVRLPDNTLATELVADPEKITFSQNTYAGLKFITSDIKVNGRSLLYATTSEALILTNGLTSQALEQPTASTCDLANKTLLIEILPQGQRLFKIQTDLKKLSKIKLIANNLGNFKICFDE